MSLLDDYMTACVMLDKTSASDGEGGRVTQWVDGATFDAAIVLDNSTAARIAAKEGVTNLYTVTTSRVFPLAFHDVFRRESDGQVFRVTSNGDDKQTPATTPLDMCQASAEEWKLS